MDHSGLLPALPPTDAWPGCVPGAQAQARVGQWLGRNGIDLQGMGVAEALSAASYLKPALAPVAGALQAWLACLSGPDWSTRSIEEIHRTAAGRWPDRDEHEARRRLVAEIEGGLSGPSSTGAPWAVWLPTTAGGFVVYDGTQPARWVPETGE